MDYLKQFIENGYETLKEKNKIAMKWKIAYFIVVATTFVLFLSVPFTILVIPISVISIILFTLILLSFAVYGRYHTKKLSLNQIVRLGLGDLSISVDRLASDKTDKSIKKTQRESKSLGRKIGFQLEHGTGKFSGFYTVELGFLSIKHLSSYLKEDLPAKLKKVTKEEKRVKIKKDLKGIFEYLDKEEFNQLLIFLTPTRENTLVESVELERKERTDHPISRGIKIIFLFFTLWGIATTVISILYLIFARILHIEVVPTSGLLIGLITAGLALLGTFIAIHQKLQQIVKKIRIPLQTNRK